jgi:hypothetical protein
VIVRESPGAPVTGRGCSNFNVKETSIFGNVGGRSMLNETVAPAVVGFVDLKGYPETILASGTLFNPQASRKRPA